MIDAVSVIAEFLGTLLLVLSVLASGGNAFVIGATLAVIVLLTGKISGGQVNPGISAAMYMKGSLSFSELIVYVTAQVLGGISSLYVYRAFS